MKGGMIGSSSSNRSGSGSGSSIEITGGVKEALMIDMHKCQSRQGWRFSVQLRISHVRFKSGQISLSLVKVGFGGSGCGQIRLTCHIVIQFDRLGLRINVQISIFWGCVLGEGGEGRRRRSWWRKGGGGFKSGQ